MQSGSLLGVAERQKVAIDGATRSAVAAAFDALPHRIARREAITRINAFLSEERAALARTRSNAHAASGRQTEDAVTASIEAKLADHAAGRTSRA